MSAPRRVSLPLPSGAQRMTLVVEGAGWQHRQVFELVDGSEWRVTFAHNRLEAVAATRNRAEQTHIAAFSAALNATPDLVKREMREWMADRRMRLATITAPDLAAANSELQRRLAAAAEGVAVPAPDVPSAVTADEQLDGEATSADAGTATVSRFAEMLLPDLLVELRARGLEGSFDDADEIRDFLEQLEAEEASEQGSAG